MASSTDHGFVGSWVRSPPSTIINFSDLPHVELEKHSLRYTQGLKRLGCIDRSTGISGRPAIPPFRGGESVIRLSLGKLLVNILQVVKRTNTPLIPEQIPVFSDEGYIGLFLVANTNNITTHTNYSCCIATDMTHRTFTPHVIPPP